MHSSSSLYINFMSPINNINKNINNINKSKKELVNNESLKNKMILTSVDNSSVIASKEKILSYNQNNKQKCIQQAGRATTEEGLGNAADPVQTQLDRINARRGGP